MNDNITASEFLSEAYRNLDFESGAGYYKLQDLINITPNLAISSWINQARQLGAESIFFVNDYPTVLFFNVGNSFSSNTIEIEDKIRELHIKVWNTSLIPIIFIALPGELRVYSAYQKPIEDVNTWCSEKRWIKKIKQVTQFAELSEFSRPQIEAGNLFNNRSKDFDRSNRVDQWLLKNLRLLRNRLEGEIGEKREYAHALIGRSIFIRYLEDRHVLVDGYFSDKTISRSGNYNSYIDVLICKADTYNLFHKLSNDFNGDLFPLRPEEENNITEDDLKVLRDFLRGRSLGNQIDLLFWAYKFNIIPIELISSIYEEFYQEFGGDKDRGTHYTPMTLVNLILNETLTPKRLDSNPRVLDCACGSGVFLVEAFKRIVYHECLKLGVGPTGLSRENLINILTERIVGIDVNKAAVQIAAFSLYLCFLDFREPPDIREHKKLPKLVYENGNGGRTLYCSNTFYPTAKEKAELINNLSNRKFKEVVRKSETLPLDNNTFDVIIGNPPWGSLKVSEEQLPVYWCKAFGYPVGDKELSQCFIWRTRSMVKPEGEIGLLVSTGVLFKHHKQSKNFRTAWLERNHIRAVYNFAHVRDVFFKKQKKKAIAPFAAVFFKPAINETIDNNVFYCNAKQSALIEKLQAVVLNKADLKIIPQKDLMRTDWLWKTLMWGTQLDVELVGELKSCYKVLEQYVTKYGEGFIEKGNPQKKNTNDLGVEFELDTKDLKTMPEFVRTNKKIEFRPLYRSGTKEVFTGPRLLIERGVQQSKEELGIIQARLAEQDFAFKNSILGFRLDKLNESDREVLLGITLSSLAKYYYFLTCSTWGFWHNEIHEEEYLGLPIKIPEDTTIAKKIVKAMRGILPLTSSNDITQTLFYNNKPSRDKLDEAVFDLYGLSKSQRDLVRDLCKYTLDFYYCGTKSNAMKCPKTDDLENYRDAFLEIWRERLLIHNEKLVCEICAPEESLLIGMEFRLEDAGNDINHTFLSNTSECSLWFNNLSRLLRKEITKGIYIDRVAKEITDASIIIMKRSEMRNWTLSQARNDAQEILTEVFKLEFNHTGRNPN